MSVDVHNAAKRGSSNVNLLHPIRPGNVAAIADYIRAGGDLYIQDTHGNPPLHVAAYYGRAASVAALLGAGVDPDALNNAGQTPLYYAEENGHEDCLCLLRGEAPPTPRSAPRQQTGSDQGKTDGSDRGKKKKNNKDRESRSSATNPRAPDFKGEPSLPLPTPPRFAASTHTSVPSSPSSPLEHQDSEATEWHLCHDDQGNAYYYNETTGESVWAEGGEIRTEDSTSLEQATLDCMAIPPPPGWSLHYDPTTGHPYYLDDATNESMWAESDGSFPAQGVATRAMGKQSTGEDNTEACAEWDAEIYCGEDRPAPSAPPPFSCTLDPSQDGGEEPAAGNDMLLCTRGIMSKNIFFAAREFPLPTSSGGSPMASAPLPVESGGTRSVCTPRRACSAPPPEEEENSGSVYDHNDHHSNHHSNHNNNQDNRNDQRFIDSREGENEGQDELATAPAVRGRVVAGSSESSQGRPGTSVENANIAAGTRPMLHLDMGCTTAEDEPASSMSVASGSDSTRCCPPSSTTNGIVPSANTKPSAPSVPTASPPSIHGYSEATPSSPGAGSPLKTSPTGHGGADGDIESVTPSTAPPPPDGGKYELLRENSNKFPGATPCYPKLDARGAATDSVADVEQGMSARATRTAVSLRGNLDTLGVGGGERAGAGGGAPCPLGGVQR